MSLRVRDNEWSPEVGHYIQHNKIWRWEVVAGACLMNGYRYGAELGVSTGRFTMFLCALIPGMKMVAVDLWAPQPENTGAEKYTDWDHEGSYRKFSEICRSELPGRVQIIRDTTLNAAKLIADEALDFVFVDADHSYEACKADIEAWTPKIRPGGMICGHDFNWPGVEQAVRETGNAAVTHDNVWMRGRK